MTFRNIFILFLPLLILLGGCGASAPTVDYDPDALRASRRTFAVEEGAGAHLEPLDAERFHRAVTALLKAKGYGPAARPDFIARYDLYVVKDVPSKFSFGFGIGGYGHHGGGSLGTTVTPTEDRLGIRIDMLDVGTRRVFWHAAVEKPMPRFTTPRSRTDFFDAVTRELLKNFPEAAR